MGWESRPMSRMTKAMLWPWGVRVAYEPAGLAV